MKKSLFSVLFVLSISFAAFGNVPSRPLPDLPVKLLPVYTDFEAEWMAFVDAAYYFNKAHNENGDTIAKENDLINAYTVLLKYSKKQLQDSLSARFPFYPNPCWVKCSHDYYECIRNCPFCSPSLIARHCRRGYDDCMRGCAYTPVEL